MNVTYHAHERYCERFMNMQNKKEIKEYLVDKENQKMVTESIMDIYSKSSFLYSGIILREDPVRVFHITEDIILCIDKDYANILTLYKIDYGFPSDTTRIVVDNLLSEIHTLRDDLIKEEEDINIYKAQCEFEMQRLDEDINDLQARILVLNKKKQIVTDQLKVRNSAVEFLNTNIRKYAMQLVNSWEYKRDFSKDLNIK